jgi:hypothetical protein
MTSPRSGIAGARADLRSLRRELPWLVLAVALLVVLLHANAPEVWFWFAALLVLLLWRSLACRGRWRAALPGEADASRDQG